MMQKRYYITFVNSVTGDFHSHSYLLDDGDSQTAGEWLEEAARDGVIEKWDINEMPDLPRSGLDALGEELDEQRELAAGGAL